ncbi:sugar ABC transporter substrate-binding protein [Anaerotalea alkaliphila]|uniref:Substrate-binding domain-containing protein n=1 Tax=Anaerotalea alkaliphila TaxID=2662126 RepID=A0A7X5KLZ7_9FIRM|nr:sugar ABC transporter substrate-binding protein [Anaerotalea alkaliphila]NDL66434.1 substrate-binding domain-containing protein [Anaerotalea alkaliphila]
MKRFKRITSLLVVGALSVAMFAGCGKSEPTTPPAGGETGSGTEAPATDTVYKVGYVNSSDTDFFDKLKRDTFETVVKDDKTLEVSYSEANMDVQRQLDLMDNYIAQGVDAIILVPADFSGVTPGIEKANAAGIPVICMGIEAEAGDFIFVGSQNFDAGVMQGEFMAEALPENAKVLYLQGTPGLYHSVEREDGFKGVLAEKRPDIEVIATQTGMYERARGMQITEDWVQTFPAFDAIVAANDQMALGAIEALKGANRLEGVAVSGIDGTPEAKTAIGNGEMAQSVLQSADGLAQYTYETIQTLQSGGTPEARIIVPFESITAENLADYQ